MSELFYKQIPLRSADDAPIFTFPDTILMQERPRPKETVVLGDEDGISDEMPPAVSGMLGYLLRWPHLTFDSIDAFEDMKTLEPNDAFVRIQSQTDNYLNSWREGNLVENVVDAPAVTGIRKKAKFVALGVNQYFAAGFMFLGKENTAHSYRLWTLRHRDAVWKEAPEALSFPSHNGVGLLNGGYKLFVFCKQTLRCIDCMSAAEPFALWTSEEIKAEDTTLAADYVCGIRAAFGRVFLETFDSGIKLFDADTGVLLQTILPELLVISIACSHELLLVGSDSGVIEAYGPDDKQKFQLLGRFQYGGEVKTKGDKTLAIEKKPVVQLAALNSKLCFSMDKYVIMEEKNPQMKKLRVLTNPRIVGLYVMADYVMRLSADGVLRVGFFAETGRVFECDFKKLVGTEAWRHNREYCSGTFSHFYVLLPSGACVNISLQKFLPPEQENKES